MASMLCCSITAVSFSSVFYILICGAVGLVVFFLRKIRKGDGKTSWYICVSFWTFWWSVPCLSAAAMEWFRWYAKGRFPTAGWQRTSFWILLPYLNPHRDPCREYGNLYRLNTGGILGSFVATLGVVLPSFLIILLIASALKNLMKYAPVNAFLSGVRPCVVAMILATALSMALSTLFGLTDLQAGFAPDLRSIAVFAMLGATHLICKIIRKTAPSPILMILFQQASESCFGEYSSMAIDFISNFNSNSCWTALISLHIISSDITLHSWCRSALRPYHSATNKLTIPLFNTTVYVSDISVQL